MALTTVILQDSINISVQVGDILYGSVVVNSQSGKNHPSPGNEDTKPFPLGKIVDIVRQSNQIHFDTKDYYPYGSEGNFPALDLVYLFASKDNRVNMSGILGYFAEVEFKNYSSKRAEIFVTAIDYAPSSK